MTYYDIVVVGDELAGAVAAALLARRGYRVLVLCSPPAESETLAGHRFPRAPLALAGWEGHTFKRLLTELNLLQPLRRRLVAHHPGYQVILPEHRIDVGEDLEREVARELPEDVGHLEAWIAAAQPVNAMLDTVLMNEVLLPPESFWDRRDLKRIATQLPRDEAGLLATLPPGRPIRSLLSLPVGFAAHVKDPGGIAHARLGEQYRTGTWGIEGGREALRALLYERVQSAAGEVRHDLVRGLVTKRGRVVGVGVGDKSQTVGCELVVGAASAAELLALYPDEPSHKLRQAAAHAPAAWRYQLHFVAPVSALPDPLASLAYIVRDPAAPLYGGNALMLHVSEGHGQTVTLTVEALANDVSPAGLAALRASIQGTMTWLFPFLDRHLMAVWSPHEARPPETQGPEPLPGASDAPSPGGTPRAPEPLWSFEAPELGICGLPYTLGVKGLVLASRQILPSLGLEGELAAGWGAARIAGMRHKRRDIDKGIIPADL
ncbi:MAG TPA: hypothetical protein VH877_17860 [Polyangia bacterium]|jgi:hypothetical protein|nr:hypothetical protein [Polyangia bacterium]